VGRAEPAQWSISHAAEEPGFTHFNECEIVCTWAQNSCPVDLRMAQPNLPVREGGQISPPARLVRGGRLEFSWFFRHIDGNNVLVLPALIDFVLK
jgi:hypothetical protein